jgi:hypothetical protein
MAIVDSGITATHPDMAGAVVAAYDFYYNTPTIDVQHLHGTAVASFAAGRADGSGVIGVAPGVSLIDAKVTSASGLGTASALVEGIVWAADQGADVINISMGSTVDTGNVLRDALQYAVSKGSVVVCASGNQAGAVKYPAAHPECIAVGAIDSSRQHADFSNFGPSLDLVAPGRSMVYSLFTGGLSTGSGTSFATPHVAGAAALLRQNGVPAANVADQLKATAVDLGTPGRDDYYGAGMLDVAAALGITQNPDGSGTDGRDPAGNTCWSGTVRVEAGRTVKLGKMACGGGAAWSVYGTQSGTITNTGVYTAPLAVMYDYITYKTASGAEGLVEISVNRRSVSVSGRAKRGKFTPNVDPILGSTPVKVQWQVKRGSAWKPAGSATWKGRWTDGGRASRRASKFRKGTQIRARVIVPATSFTSSKKSRWISYRR